VRCVPRKVYELRLFPPSPPTNSYHSYPTRSLKTFAQVLEAQYLPLGNLHATLCAKLTRYNVRGARELRRFRVIVAGHRNTNGIASEKNAQNKPIAIVTLRYVPSR